MAGVGIACVDGALRTRCVDETRDNEEEENSRGHDFRAERYLVFTIAIFPIISHLRIACLRPQCQGPATMGTTIRQAKKSSRDRAYRGISNCIYDIYQRNGGRTVDRQVCEKSGTWLLIRLSPSLSRVTARALAQYTSPHPCHLLHTL